MESLRTELHGSGVSVVCICPGYIDTPMTRVNRFRMPFLLSADEAARRIARAIAAQAAARGDSLADGAGFGRAARDAGLAVRPDRRARAAQAARRADSEGTSRPQCFECHAQRKKTDFVFSSFRL